MDELKILIEMVAELPQMAIWVLVLFFCYKTVVIGSIFGIGKMLIEKIHSVLTTPRHELKIVDIRVELDGNVISGGLSPLLSQISRMRVHCNLKRKIDTDYIHGYHTEWLEKAITNQIKIDQDGES